MPVSINPATEESFAEYATMPYPEVEGILKKTAEAARSWKEKPISARAALLNKAAGILDQRKEALALLITREMGKPISEAKGEIDKCAWVCRYYAEEGPAFLADEPISTDADISYVGYRPLGVVLAVMPWNFPFWQAFRFAAPGLTAGNGGILKHASNVTGCALAIESVFKEAGYPESIFRTVITGSEEIEKAIHSPYIQAVTLTGSGPAGSAVASTAGKALKKTVLELGGSDPYIILEDADLDLAAQCCAKSRMINGGQSCIAAKRFIVCESVAEAFTRKFVAEIQQYEMGDPEATSTNLGPMARGDLRQELHEQVLKSIEQGAHLLTGGTLPEGKGFFYPATVLGNVTEGMTVYEEETFGPVAAIIIAKDAEDCLRIANDSPFGLGAAVFSRDNEAAEAMAARIACGTCAINDLVKSDPRLPFGGIGESGYGRELSQHGIREFVNAQTIAGRRL